MVIQYTGSKGEPVLVPSGAAPTFAADGTEIAQWLQKGRSFRKLSTQALLNTATGMEDNDLAVVDAIDGATFKYDGSGGTWVMSGCPPFASTAARNAAITAPVTGMFSWITTERFIRRYNGSAWVPFGASAYPIVPTGQVNGVIGDGGKVTFAAASAVSLVGCFPSGDFTRFIVHWRLSAKSASTDLLARLRVAGTDQSAATTYGTMRSYTQGSTTTNDHGDSDKFTLDAGNGRSSGEIDLIDPNVAGPTQGTLRAVGGISSTSGQLFRIDSGLVHDASTACDGITLYVASGNISGEAWVEGI